MATHPRGESRGLQQLRVLITDQDYPLANVLRHVLVKFGFPSQNITITKTADDAWNILTTDAPDILITDWQMPQLDAPGLIRRVRRDAGSPQATLPVIMLTGRAERSDVEAARDAGINEFIVKPFTARNILDRLAQIIDHPRPFVISPPYAGPCRRRQGKPPPGKEERRGRPLTPVHGSRTALSGHEGTALWLADDRLQQTLGLDGKSLSILITPGLVEQAQASIDAISDSSLQWIKADMQNMEGAFQGLLDMQSQSAALYLIMEAALTVKNRAGTFGYGRASAIAYQLYRFCRERAEVANLSHHTVILKHIEVLKVLFGQKMKGDAGDMGALISSELKQLVDKYAA